MKKRKQIIRKIAEVFDWYIYNGEVFSKYEQQKKDFDKTFCDYVDTCNKICKDCEELEEQIFLLNNDMKEKKDELENTAEDVLKLLDKIRRKRRKKKKGKRA